MPIISFPPEENISKAEKKSRKREADTIGRKELEAIDLGYFTEAYEYSLGETLNSNLFSSSERPDFICERPSGERIGVELTQVIGDPAFPNFLKEFMDGFEASEEVYRLIENKERKRVKPDWILPDNSILVIQLMNYSLREGDGLLLEGLGIDDLPTHGFNEIWLGDYTGLDAYGDIELFCSFPEEMWGYYERWNPGRKPYG